MREFGINLHAVGGLSDEQYIKAIAALGFTATFDLPCEAERQKQLARLADKYGVRFDTLHAPFRRINDMWSQDEVGDAMLDVLKKTVDHCLIVGAPIAVVHLSSGENAPAITDVGRDRFSRLVKYAATKNVKIAFENQRKLANLAWAFETFDESIVGFCWDCGHESCFTPGRKYMPLFANRLACVHIHDNFGVYNEDSHLLPFDGKIDFEQVAAQLRSASFDGALMLEAVTENSNVYNGIDPLQYLEHAATAAHKLAEMV